MNDKHILIPKRRFKEFENADAWEQRKLSDASIINPKSEIPTSFKYVDLESVLGTSLLGYKIESKESAPSRAQRVAKKGDIFYQTVRPYQKNNYYFCLDEDDYVFSTGYAQIRPNCSGLFLFTYLQLDDFVLTVLNNCTGTSYPAINSKVLSNLQIRTPQIQEQEKIGDFFNSLENLITLHQRKLNKLEEIKSAYLAEMFPIQGEFKPKRRFSGFKEDWNWSALKVIGNTFTGLSGKTKEDFGHGEAKFITYMNVYSNPISDLNGLENIEIDKKQFQVKYGDVLFTTSSETPEEVGMSSVWLGNEEDVYLNSFCFGFRPSVDIDKYYLAFMLRSVSIRKKFQLLAQGISRYNISKNKVMEMSIPLPCIDEQKKIGLLFKNIEQTIHSQKETVEKLINLKNAYLNEMFV